MIVPVAVRGELIGILHLATAMPRRLDTDDAALAKEIAQNLGAAIDRAQVYRRLECAIRDRDDLLAVVSHDLKTPIQSIVFAAELLSPARAAGERRSAWRQVDVIKRAAHHMHRLVFDLLDASAIEAGRLTVEPKPEDLHPILDEVKHAFEPQARARSISLETAHTEDLPLVRCDRGRIIQVISNLVGNAIKFTPKGGAIRIEASALPDRMRLSVHDTGHGIAPEDREHLFERYWRGRNRGHHGSGLGLCIAKGIVEAHGGTIWAESTLGAGSRFFFTLPLQPLEARAPRRTHAEDLAP
jgi:signal transduction histidine kinase